MKKNENSFLLKQLEKPAGHIDVVLDTDTYNEIDDQYALAYLVKSTEKLNPLAVYAAPFSNSKASTPHEGMERSYEEILNILNLCGKSDMHKNVFRGSVSYLKNERTPAESDAAFDLIKKANEHTPENPLYVATIGAITNIASAILIDPDIIDKIVIVWLGGHSMHIPNHGEFNMMQDIAAARVVFNSTAPLVQLPCQGVVTHLTTTEPELRHHLKGKSALGDYLYTITCKEVSSYNAGSCWSRVIWDVSAVAWLLNEHYIHDYIVSAPIPTYDNGYTVNHQRHLMRIAYGLNRDAIFADLFNKIANK